MSLLPLAANKIWILSQIAEYKRFIRACKQPETAQHHKLLSYIQQNVQTQFGEAHHFDEIETYEQFSRQVPIQNWDDIQLWIDRILNGEEKVLTAEPIIAFEETSGTTSMVKLVPYTQSLRNEFQMGVAAWISLLAQSHPKAFYGPSYWSVSPATRTKRMTPNGIPIGLESDGDYFNPITRFLLNQIWAVSPAITQETHPEAFYLKTLQQLLLSENLSMISVWSPGFLIQLDQFLQTHKQKISSWLSNTSKGNKRRKSFLLACLRSDFSWDILFPKLKLISCWTHAQAALSLPTLKTRTGAIPIQSKGLLATEGITSIPVHPDYYPAISLRSHFYEFRHQETQKIALAHELEVQQTYEVILTTGGGLYRYASGDLIKVRAYFHQNPCLEFIGRGNKQCDLVGEKLSEPQVVEALGKIPEGIRSQINHVFLYPISQDGQHGYQLFVSFLHDHFSSNQIEEIRQSVENQLTKNPYYAQAVRLNQLQALAIQILSEENALKLTEFLKQKRKIKDGDFKMPVLFEVNSLSEIISSFSVY